MRTYEEMRAAALDALDAGEVHRAFQHLRPVLEYPGPASGTAFAESLSVFARISARLGAADLARLAEAASRTPDDTQSLYDLGYSLFEESLHGIAATVLAHAFAAAPQDDGVLAELVASLDASMRYGEALRVLRGAPDVVARTFAGRYLLAFNALMTGAVDESRAAFERIAPGDDENERSMARRIERMLARADAIASTRASTLDARDLRGWHYVVTGGLLLHRSPYGYDDGMNGRYAFTQDSPGRCALGIRTLAAVLDATGVKPARVRLLPERESRVLGSAAARILSLPVVEWNAGATGQGDLVIAYDLATLDDAVLRALVEHRDGRTLFAHATCWTNPPRFAPDVTTYLYQTNQSPWGARLRVGEGTDASTVPADESPADALADAIAGAPSDCDEIDGDERELLALASTVAHADGPARPALLAHTGRRERVEFGSPVGSSRFF